MQPRIKASPTMDVAGELVDLVDLLGIGRLKQQLPVLNIVFVSSENYCFFQGPKQFQYYPKTIHAFFPGFFLGFSWIFLGFSRLVLG